MVGHTTWAEQLDSVPKRLDPPPLTDRISNNLGDIFVQPTADIISVEKLPVSHWSSFGFLIFFTDDFHLIGDLTAPFGMRSWHCDV